MNEPERHCLSVFGEAFECASPQERFAYLDRACGQDSELRARVEELLRAHEAAGGFLQGNPSTHVPESLAPDGGSTVPESVRERPGAVIGAYKLLEQIGEGGFGIVFMAEQQQPIRRKVALKVLKPGMDTRQVVARFEAERQALALMDHPNIAHVFDGGETATGRPYFVMELVKGVPITTFCDQNQLSVRQRLELFAGVCQAVQHAHQKGIIHRDLKPSNVLVTGHDGTPVVKVIDFGIAKATGAQLTDKTLFTHLGQMIGTPLYMSPEQAGMSGLDVDTRSDIYSLGVVLYELLTGTTPFDKDRLKELGYDELRRIIREEEPPRPSTRISTLGQAVTTVSTQRKSNPKRLSQLCRGELDWIVMKCLEKDRNRRYDSASAFAADVQRHLNDEPVVACPPSAGYRLRKFVRRNKGPVLAAALVLTALLGGITGTTLGLMSARASADAERAARKAEAAERRKAIAAEVELQRSRLQLSQKIAIIQMRVESQEAEVARSTRENNRMVKLGAFNCFSQEELQAARQKLALDKAKLAELKAEQFQLREVARRQHLLGLDHPVTLASLPDLARVYEQAKRWADAEEVYKELAALQGRKSPLGSPELATVARLGRCLLHQKKYAEAEACLREGLWARPKEKPDDWLLDETRGLLGESLLGQQKYAEAEPLLLRGYEGLKQREDTIPAAERVCLAEALERLVRLYDATRQRSKADAWQKKLEEATIPPTDPKP